jgi:dihydropyrimidine dehydrogenase (NAD+) subunit PreA
VPVLVKLTPNVDDIVPHGLAAQAGGADGVSLINTIKSIIGVDIDRFVLEPRVGGCRPTAATAGRRSSRSRCTWWRPGPRAGLRAADQRDRRDRELARRGGVYAARLLSVQVCTEVMLRGYRVVEDMIEGLTRVHARARLRSNLERCVGKAVPSYSRVGRARPEL